MFVKYPDEVRYAEYGAVDSQGLLREIANAGPTVETGCEGV
jgi:hypothetical protein